MKMLQDYEAQSGFFDSKTPELTTDQNLWYKTTARTVAPWDASKFYYTADVYASPYATSSIKTGVKLLNAAEMNGANSFLPIETWCRSIDYFNKNGDWYHLVNVSDQISVGYLSNPQGQAYPPSWSYDLYADSSYTKLIKAGVSVSSIAASRTLGAYANSSAGVCLYIIQSNGVPLIIAVGETSVLEGCT